MQTESLSKFTLYEEKQPISVNYTAELFRFGRGEVSIFVQANGIDPVPGCKTYFKPQPSEANQAARVHFVNLEPLPLPTHAHHVAFSASTAIEPTSAQSLDHIIVTDLDGVHKVMVAGPVV